LAFAAGKKYCEERDRKLKEEEPRSKEEKKRKEEEAKMSKIRR